MKNKRCIVQICMKLGFFRLSKIFARTIVLVKVEVNIAQLQLR